MLCTIPDFPLQGGLSSQAKDSKGFWVVPTTATNIKNIKKKICQYKDNKSPEDWSGPIPDMSCKLTVSHTMANVYCNGIDT
jgi:hypothetical protein